MSGPKKIWGKPEWQKDKYQTGKMIFCNATHLDEKWTPTGQDVTLTEASRLRRVPCQCHVPIEEAQIDELDPNLVTRQNNSVLVAAVATQDSQGRLHGLWVEGPAIPYG